MRLGLECHYQRCTSSLALHHPLIANKVEYSIEQLPRIFDESKIADNTSSIKTSLRALLLIACHRRHHQFDVINSIDHGDIEPGITSYIPHSLTSIDDVAGHRRAYVGGMINNSGGTLYDDMNINKNWKLRKQLKPVKRSNNIEDYNDKISKFSVDMNSDETPKSLPVIEVIKKSTMMQTHSNGNSTDSKTIKKIPVKSSKISQWGKYSEKVSQPKKNRHIQEFLERIMQKDKEERELSQSVIVKQNKDGEKFSRSQSIEPGSVRRSTQKQEGRFNFTSSRQPETIKSNNRGNDPIASIDTNKRSEYRELGKGFLNKVKPKCSNSPDVYYQNDLKKFKVVSKKDRDLAKTGKCVQEGGTVSTQDY